MLGNAEAIANHFAVFLGTGREAITWKAVESLRLEIDATGKLTGRAIAMGASRRARWPPRVMLYIKKLPNQSKHIC